MQANLYAHIDTDFRGKFTLKMNVNLMKSTQVELYENNLFLYFYLLLLFLICVHLLNSQSNVVLFS